MKWTPTTALVAEESLEHLGFKGCVVFRAVEDSHLVDLRVIGDDGSGKLFDKSWQVFRKSDDILLAYAQRMFRAFSEAV